MEGESLWLGRLRQAVRWLMIATVGLAALLILWLIISNNLLGGEVGMYEAVRPHGRPIVAIMLTALVLGVVVSGVYLSDWRGVIEIKHGGFFDLVSLVCSRIAMICVAFIVLVMFYEVIARYVFSEGTRWANELSKWIAGFVFLFSGLYAMQQRSHIRIYILYDMMPRWAKKSADVFSVFLLWVFAFCVIWGGYNEAVAKFLRGETYGTAWDPPIPATIKPAIIIIIIMVAIQALSNLIADWSKAEEHHSPLDDIDETEIENIRRTLK
ncbi:MAG: TRAP transporter small permease [Pseudomonadota bacterium]